MSLVWVAYAADESHPLANGALIEGTLHTTLELSQTARFTCVLEPFTHEVVPLFAKNTAKLPLSPGAKARKALSNWYAESKPTAAWAGRVPNPRIRPSASATEAIGPRV